MVTKVGRLVVLDVPSTTNSGFLGDLGPQALSQIRLRGHKQLRRGLLHPRKVQARTQMILTWTGREVEYKKQNIIVGYMA